MESWLVPALIAALVSVLVSVGGWFATFYMGLRRDELLRDEKMRDFQVALRAEIVSDVLTMAVADRSEFLTEARRRYAVEPGYSIIVPHMAHNLMFESSLGEIQVLPGEVITPVVHYERMRETVERFVADLRDDSFRQSPIDRQVLMYSDYLRMLDRLEQLARDALASLEQSLNTPAEDRSSPMSASAADEALASQREQP